MIYKNQDTLLKKKIVGEKEYKYEDHLGSYKLDQFQASGSDSTRNARPNLYYPIYLSSDGKLYTEEQHDTIKIILPKKFTEKMVDGCGTKKSLIKIPMIIFIVMVSFYIEKHIMKKKKIKMYIKQRKLGLQIVNIETQLEPLN